MLKGKIINIEWFGGSDDQRKTHLLKEIQLAADQGYSNVVLIMLMDGFLPLVKSVFNEQMKFINAESKKLGIQNIVLVSGHGESFDGLENKFFFIDYTLRMTYNAYKENLEISRDPSNKILFLGGVPTRPNRIGLLKRFYESNNLEKLEWSFFLPESELDKQWCRDYCSSYDDDQYNNFLHTCQRSVDSLYKDCRSYFGNYAHEESKDWCTIVEKDFIKNPGYIEPAIFSNTLFSVLSEGINYWSWSTDFEFVTEKFWRTILMKHAFVFSGYPQQFYYIKKLGFRTFENYLPYKDYTSIEDEEERLDVVVKNSLYLLENYHKHKQEIQDDVEYNFTLALEYIQKQNNIFEILITDYGVDENEIKFYLDRSGYEHLIRRFPQ